MPVFSEEREMARQYMAAKEAEVSAAKSRESRLARASRLVAVANAYEFVGIIPAHEARKWAERAVEAANGKASEGREPDAD